jgi:DNA modification methylase
MTVSYNEFIKGKKHVAKAAGFKPHGMSPMLYPFQAKITEWATRRGRSAVFADCGLGKTPIQLVWAQQVVRHTKMAVLVVAPLAVSVQTIREGDKFDITVNPCRSQADVLPGINITNYEMVHHFDPDLFTGIVLDESSILKSYSGKYRQELTEFAKDIPYRLCCTATPAPNDLIEMVNHSEFLGIMSGKEIIGCFFKQDGNTTHQWRLKNHAREDFWKWMASWSVAVRQPSDLGYDDGDFILPDLNIHQHTVNQRDPAEGFLFAMPGNTLSEQRANRKATLEDRIAKAKELIEAEPDEHWLIWCDLNYESEMGRKAFNAVEVKGSDSQEHKENALLGFAAGDIKRLITKPSIAGFGMNWQNCSRVIFLGLSHSYEQYYQAIRRVWRFGQTRPVDVHLVVADTDGPIKENIERKEKQAGEIMDEIVNHMKDIQLDRIVRDEMKYETDHKSGLNWDLYLGDSIELTDKIETESVGMTIFSPPFPGMYVYTNSERDVGNCATIEELIGQFSYLMPSLLRVTKPGRSCLVHLTQGVAFKWYDGYIGLKDFRGAVIREMEKHGWIYYGEVTIDKNPQVKAIRTKDQGLLFKTLSKDSANMHMALADYLLHFRKPGDNKEPIKSGISDKYNPGNGWITSEEWIRWARPVWYGDDWAPNGDGIKETDVLNTKAGRDADDEKHICPLQLGVIERAVKLWSNPGDLVFSPFAGIGSEGYVAVDLDRRFVGIELKRSYFDAAVNNLKSARQPSLFDEMEVSNGSDDMEPVSHG